MHELTANALKHGSLSNDTGLVTITWTVTGESNDQVFMLEWRESGGPTVNEPTQRGFGSRLIKTGLSGTGGAELRYHTLGFEASFSSPLAQVQII